nr:unnamed protein product [Naegleria fowleri]
MFETKEESQNYPLKKRRSSLLGMMIPSMLLGQGATASFSSHSDLLSTTTTTTTPSHQLHVPSSSSSLNVNVCVCGTNNTGKKSLISYMVNGYHNPSSLAPKSLYDNDNSPAEDEESVESWCDHDISAHHSSVNSSIVGGSAEKNSSSSLNHPFHARTISKGDLLDVSCPDYVKELDVSGSEKLKLNFFIFSHSDTEVRSRSVFENDVSFKNIIKIAHVIIYVYDVTNMTSFESVKYYYEQILNLMSSNDDDDYSEHMENFRLSCSPHSPSLFGPILQRNNVIMKPSMVIGVKTDLEEERVVTESNIVSHQRMMNGVSFHECSCLTGENVLSCLEDLKLLSKPSSLLSKPSSGSENGRNSRRSSITISSSSSRQSMSCSSSPNLDTGNKRASRIFDSVKKVSDLFRARSNSTSSTHSTARKIPTSSPASSSAPTINDKRRSQSIGVIISQHEKNTGFVIKPEITNTEELQISVPTQTQQLSNDGESKQEVRKRPTSYSWKNIFKKKY